MTYVLVFSMRFIKILRTSSLCESYKVLIISSNVVPKAGLNLQRCCYDPQFDWSNQLKLSTNDI